jgi:hypothetical protein
VLLLVAFPRLWFQAQAFADSGVSPLTMIPNVRRTTWGVGLAVQCVSAAIAFLGFIVGRVRPRVGWWIATLAILGLTVSPAMLGPPIAAERNRRGLGARDECRRMDWRIVAARARLGARVGRGDG